MRFRSWLGTGLCALWLGACASATPPPESPSETLRAYSAALEAGDAQRAYALLSDEARKNLPFEAFERMVKENHEELRDIAAALRRPAYPPRVSATVTTKDGQQLEMLYEDGRWKVAGSAIDLYSQKTPLDAVHAFIRAYENKRYDILLRFVPEEQRQGLTVEKLKEAFEGEQREEVEMLTQTLRAELPTARVELLGDRATMAYGAAGTLELVREHGAWRIEEFR